MNRPGAAVRNEQRVQSYTCERNFDMFNLGSRAIKSVMLVSQALLFLTVDEVGWLQMC